MVKIPHQHSKFNMVSSRIFKRLLSGTRSGAGNHPLRSRNSLYHDHSHDGKDLNSISNLCRKLKDTVLLVEATNGPVVRVTCGIAQGVGTAAIIVGLGSGVTALTRQVLPAVHTAETVSPPENPDTQAAVNRRIGITYFHMMNSILASSMTGLLSFRIFRNKAFLIQLGNRPLAALGIGVVSPFLMATIVHHLPPTEAREGILIPFGMKEMGQLIYAGSIGLVAAPLYLLGGQSIYRAAFVSFGMCAGLHGVAHLAPKDAFLKWELPTRYALNAILLSFILTLVLRRDNIAFNPLYKFMMHGGLIAYSAHYLYNIQAIQRAAKLPSFDPVNASMGLTMDLMNLYARLAFLLPPHFQLSRDHHVIVSRNQSQPHPSNTTNNNNNNDNSTLTPNKKT